MFETMLGVFKTILAASANTLEDLKKSNPLLVVEILPDMYVLVDGNHRLCIQWEDVSI
jgi:hypothetical protein